MSAMCRAYAFISRVLAVCMMVVLFAILKVM